MTTVNLLRGTLHHADTGWGRDDEWRDDVPSLASALRALLVDTRTGRVEVAAPGSQWLVLRIEEALCGFDHIQQMAAEDEPALPALAGGTTRTASILAQRAGR